MIRDQKFQIRKTGIFNNFFLAEIAIAENSGIALSELAKFGKLEDYKKIVE